VGSRRQLSSLCCYFTLSRPCFFVMLQVIFFLVVPRYMYNRMQNVHTCKADMFLSLFTHLFLADWLIQRKGCSCSSLLTCSTTCHLSRQKQELFSISVPDTQLLLAAQRSCCTNFHVYLRPKRSLCAFKNTGGLNVLQGQHLS
jgi:hypothetical protein